MSRRALFSLPSMSRPLTVMLVSAVLSACAAGCGEQRDASRPARSTGRPDAPAIATRADAVGRIVVATVNGEPIYGDCVAAQAAAAGGDREAALATCIDFELMAQQALRRGLLGDPEVLAARRTEMVRALVVADFAPTLDDPSDVPTADVRWLWDSQLARRYNKPERRRATYCRAPFPRDTPAGVPEDRQARKLAEELHAALSQMRDLEPGRFAALCWMAAGGREVKTTPVVARPFSRQGRHQGGAYAAAFAEAAFAIARVGEVSQPTRTSWGWDVVLLTEILPAETHTLQDVEAEIREMLIRRPETADYRDRKFRDWIAPYLAAARIEVYPDNLPDEQALARTAATHPPGREAGR